MPDIAPANGFRDLLPAEKAKKEDLLARIRSVYRRFGFDEIETPAAEPLERLRKSEGGENLSLIFQIMKRGLDAKAVAEAQDPSQLCDLGLRYDLTVPLARFYASNHAQLPHVLRTIQIGPVWRAERPGKGRYRQFTQCDIDIIGESSCMAEIELILATLRALEEVGVAGGTVRLNDRRFLDGILTHAGIGAQDQARALVIVDKLDKLGAEGVRAELASAIPGDSGARLMDLLTGAHEGLDALVTGKGVPLDPAAVAAHRAIMDAVTSVAGPGRIAFDPTLVRGMGYYTGAIFEIGHPGSKSSIGGGGRYDAMIGKFIGRPTPACGFSLGFERLTELTSAREQHQVERIAIIYGPEDDPVAVATRQAMLLKGGASVRLVPAAKNMTRVFNELQGMGVTRFQRMSDPAGELRPLPPPQR